MESKLGLLLPDLNPRHEEQKYLEKMTDILAHHSPGTSYTSSGPAQLMDHLFLGNLRDANNVGMLRRLRITHVLNCAAKSDYSRGVIDNPYNEPDLTKSGVKYYLKFEAVDNASYPILMHYKDAKEFIEKARDRNERVLVHCEMGVNRSAALCIAYMMDHDGITLVQAIRSIKFERSVVLCNEGFRKQLYYFARDRGFLERRK